MELTKEFGKRFSKRNLWQMQMYVNYCDRFVKLPDENNTIGIIICKEKNDTLVKMTLPENNQHIFANRYMTVISWKEGWKKVVDEKSEKE